MTDDNLIEHTDKNLLRAEALSNIKPVFNIPPQTTSCHSSDTIIETSPLPNNNAPSKYDTLILKTEDSGDGYSADDSREERQSGEAANFSDILDAIGGFGRQQKVMFCTQCVLCVFYAFVLFGSMFMSLTPLDYWCSLPQPTGALLTDRIVRDYSGNNASSRSPTMLRSDIIDKTPLTSFKNQHTDNIYGDLSSERRLENKIVTVSDENDQFGLDETTEIQESLRALTIPMSSAGGYEHCLMYDANWTEVLTSGGALAPSNSWPTKACTNGWTYDYSLYYPSITSEMSWVCSEGYRVPLSQAIFFIGSIVGGPLFGWLADARGRKSALIASNFLTGLSGVAAALSPNFIIYCGTLFVLGFNAYPQINIIYILVMEFVTPKNRSFVATIPFMLFLTLGFTILPWLAYFTAHWRLLGLIMFGPLLVTPLLWWIIPESVRWLIGDGKKTKALKTLERVAAFNGVAFTDKLRHSCKEFVNSQPASSHVSVLVLLRTPRLRKHFIALCFLLISIRLLYDCHVRITQTIKANLFVTFSVASALEVFSGLAAFIFSDRLGRRCTAVTMFFLSAGVEAARTLVTVSEGGHLEMVLHLLGKLTITTAINICFMITVEVLPTVSRSQATGVIHTLGFVMAFCSPYIVYMAESCRTCALLVLSGVSLFGGLVCLLMLPETRNTNLPDTLQEGEDFCRGQGVCYTGRRRSAANARDVL